MSSPRANCLLPVLCVFSIISGCSDPVGDAEKRFEMVSATGEVEAMCNWAQAVAAAHFEQGNQEDYVRWTETADSACELVLAKAAFDETAKDYAFTLKRVEAGEDNLQPILEEYEKDMDNARSYFLDLKKKFEAEHIKEMGL